MSRGCNDLISHGAVLVRSPEDIIDIIIKEGKTGNKKKNMDVNREKFIKEQKFFCENKKEEKDVHDFIYTELEESMKQILGSKVSIKNKKNNKGKIEIEYYSRDELERIVDMIRSI